MTEEIKKEIEEYVSDWVFDEKSKIYAFQFGKFLFGFMDYLDSLNMSDRTLNGHKDNLYLIGLFELNYGYNHEEPFDVNNFANGVKYDYEYSYKVSDSPTSLSRYSATWNYLAKYIKTKAYLEFQIS